MDGDQLSGDADVGGEVVRFFQVLRTFGGAGDGEGEGFSLFDGGGAVVCIVSDIKMVIEGLRLRRGGEGEEQEEGEEGEYDGLYMVFYG